MIWWRRSLTARAVAGVSLVAIAVWFAPPPARGAGLDPMDCAAHHTISSGATLHAAPPGGCDTGSMAGCGLMPGCGAAPPSLVAVSGFALIGSLPQIVTPRATPSDRGLLALGPPTPPPIR